MQSRQRILAKAHLRNSYFSNHKGYYFVKTEKYGIYTDIKDYYKVRVRFKQTRQDYSKKESGTKKDFNLHRARNRVFKICEANKQTRGKKKSIFFTLTTKDQLKEHKQSNKKIKQLIRRLNKYLGYNVKYIIVPELHKSGAIHYHGIFFNIPYIPVKTFRYKIWKYGSIDLAMPKKIRNISAYISKYLTKDFHTNTPLHTKLFFTSRNLVYPQIDFTDNVPKGTITERGVHLTPLSINYTIIHEK